MTHAYRVFAATALAFSLTHARADFQFTSFPSAAGLNTFGAAGVSGGALRLTPSQFDVAGAAYYGVRQGVSAGFSTTFTFRLTDQVIGSADGFAFVIHNSQVNLGGTGCRLGYHGIPNSLAVEFDCHYNATCEAGDVNDTSDNHVSVHTLGVYPNSALESASVGRVTVGPLMRDGAVHTVTVEYELQMIRVFIDDPGRPVLEVPIDLATTLSLAQGTAWVGFTAATGGFSQVHSILSWSYTSNPNPTGRHRPATPSIFEPSYDGEVLSPSDVHMETDPMIDADGDAHVCSDWEIWTVSPPERVWNAPSVEGVYKVHTHLGDGVFEGSHAGRHDLLYETNYLLKTRHRDSGPLADRQWSFQAVRTFSTVAPGAVYPLLLDDIPAAPTPLWVDESGAPVVLPGGSVPARLVLDSGQGGLLLELAGTDGSGNTIVNPGALAGHVPARVRLEAGSDGLAVPAGTLRFLHDCRLVTVSLPALTLGPSAAAWFWIAEDGATYHAQAGETEPQFSSIAEGSPVPWVTARQDIVVERFAGGFKLPVNIAFIPAPGPGENDPFFYVAELYGTIKVVTRGGAVSDYATGLLNFNPTGNFPGSGEQGLSGIVIDPANGDVLLALLYEKWPGGPHCPKILRFKSLDGGRTAASQLTVKDMPGESMSESHYISNLSIGPDGKLYVHLGDGFDIGAAQNPDTWRGKVARMNLDGSAPPDNVFYNASDGITARDYVFALGFRNPWGGAWRALDGAHYAVENGPSVDRLARIDRGRNYLWDGSDTSMMNFAIYTWYPPGAPVNIVALQTSVFGGSGFPGAMMDRFFVTESGPTWATGPQQYGKRIIEFEVGSAGDLVSGPTTLVEYVGSGKGTAVALAAGPDGLYFSDLYRDLRYTGPTDRGASVFRVRYAPITDCNGNGTPDACDIASEESTDVNSNGVPDECECVTDFNGDGFVDGIDYDLFVNAFETGDPAADVNHDGFNDGLDYDRFMNEYELGC